MRLILSKRVLLPICTVAITISAVNNYFIFDLTRSLRDVARYSDYDYVIFQDGDIIRAKDLATGPSGNVSFSKHYLENIG